MDIKELIILLRYSIITGFEGDLEFRLISAIELLFFLKIILLAFV